MTAHLVRSVASRVAVPGVASCVWAFACIVAVGCGQSERYSLDDVRPGMTDQEVAERLGPPTETMVTRSFSRDSVLWALVNSNPVPVRTWSYQMSDAELSRTVAAGDTLLSRTDRWDVWKADSLDGPIHVWSVHYAREGAQWRVETTTDRSDGVMY